jgi:hypothetical protein
MILLISCNQKPGHDHTSSTSIQLNEGQKWTVDEPMMVYIRNLENEVTIFDGETLAEYQALTAALKKNIDGLTSNCTMKGEAHDELHKWLLPFIELVDELDNSKTTAEADTKLEQIRSSFQTFNQYFQ